MKREAIEEAIESDLKKAGKTLRYKSALKAVFAILPRSEFFHQVFLGHGEAKDAERHSLEQSAIIGLLCTIDDAIAEMSEKLRAADTPAVVLDGLIETNAANAETVTGVKVDSDAGPVEFRSGTHILTTGTGTRSVTGVQIGGKREERTSNE